MKKVKLIIAAVAMLGLISLSSTTAFADGFSPGEGFYLGAFAGVGTGLVQPKVVTQGGDGTTPNGAKDSYSGEVTDGGIGLEGVEGGGWIGYGYKMGSLYAGLEGEIAAGDVTFKISGDNIEISDPNGSALADKDYTAIEAKKQWTGGAFGRLGVYLNPDTLFAVRGGVLVSKFEVSLTGSTSYTEDYYGGGPAIGASLESRLTAIDPNLSLRMDTVYTDYLTASVFGIGSLTATNEANRRGHDSEVTGSALSARVGLTYSFFDVNSLF